MTDQMIEMLIREAREIDAQVKELTALKSELVERIKKELEPGETVTVDGVRATLRRASRTFSTTTALSMMTDEMKLACVSTKIDDKLVRATAEKIGVLDQCMIVSPDAKPVLDLAK